MEVIIFGDIEAALIAHLTTELATRADTASVTGTGYKPSSPTARPDRLVVIKRIGGVRQNLVTDEANVSVHCYDPTDPRTLAARVRGILQATPGMTLSGLLIHSVGETSGPAKMPNPKSNQPRYTFALTVQYRGAAE